MNILLFPDQQFSLGGENGDDVEYTPFISKTHGHVGYKIRRGGKVRWFYLNPSDHDENPNVFVYEGDTGDPSQDGSLHFYEIEFHSDD